MQFNVPHADRNKSGVYIIRSLVDERVYVGATKCLMRRYAEHRKRLRRNAHHLKQLQDLVNKHSIAILSFSLICLCAPEDLLKTEQIYLDHYRSFEEAFGFNRAPIAGSIKGCIFTEETRAKIRARTVRPASLETRAKLSEKGKGRPVSTATRAKISNTLRGRPISDESRAKMSAAKKGSKASDEARANMSNSHKGRKLSPETKAKISEAAKARANTKPRE